MAVSDCLSPCRILTTPGQEDMAENLLGLQETGSGSGSMFLSANAVLASFWETY